MQIRCPHCYDPIEAVGDDYCNFTCPSCGSRFSLIAGETTATRHGEGGRAIGHFELVQQVGAGASGSVWKARDTQLDRMVAVKIPRNGHLAASEAEAFFREARAAAQLRHPQIVGVHEVGWDHETIYIVSDFIDGANLKEWLSSQRLSPLEAVELVARIADGLHHAHESGVVHRDLKPGNIMVDKDGQPHITDFGLAKREQGEMTITLEGRVLGTPVYMPPEQAKGEGHRADRRSDVYSLGVILFELLTGEVPFRGEAQMVLLQIQKDEPPRPRKLNGKIPRDLETITLKCLEKDPAKRYQTAAGLADDLRRWKGARPIVARPIGRVARAWRWCKRNQAVASWAAATAIALATGTAVSTYFAIRANQRAREATAERRRAEDNLVEATRQQQLAAKNLENADQQRRRAEESNRLARRAVDRYYTQVSQSTLLEEPRFAPLRKELLQAALDYYRAFVEDHSDDPEARGDVAATYFRIADLLNAMGSNEWLPAFASGFDIVKQLASEERQLSGFGTLGAGTYKNRAEYIELHTAVEVDDALDAFDKVSATYESLVERFPASAGFRNDLAGIYHTLGMLYRVKLRPSKSMTAFRNSRDHWERLVEADPRNADYRHGLAIAYTNIGLTHSYFGQFKQALAAHERAVELQDELVRDHPTATTFRRNLVTWCNNLAAVQTRLEMKGPALGSIHRAIDLEETLVAELPSDARMQRRLVEDYLEAFHISKSTKAESGQAVNPAVSRAGHELLSSATETIQHAVRAHRHSALDADAKEKAAHELSRAMCELAGTLHSNGDDRRAEELLRSAISLEDSHYTPIEQGQLATIMHKRGQSAEALAILRESLAKHQRDDAYHHWVTKFSNLYELMKTRGDDKAERLRLVEQADSFIAEARAQRGGDSTMDKEVAGVLVAVGRVLLEEGDFARAEPLLRDAFEIRQRVFAANDWERGSAEALLGACLAGMQRYDEAEPLLLSGYNHLKRSLGAGDSRTKKAVERLAAFYEVRQKPDKAAEYRKLLPAEK